MITGDLVLCCVHVMCKPARRVRCWCCVIDLVATFVSCIFSFAISCLVCYNITSLRTNALNTSFPRRCETLKISRLHFCDPRAFWFYIPLVFIIVCVICIILSPCRCHTFVLLYATSYWNKLYKYGRVAACAAPLSAAATPASLHCGFDTGASVSHHHRACHHRNQRVGVLSSRHFGFSFCFRFAAIS